MRFYGRLCLGHRLRQPFEQIPGLATKQVYPTGDRPQEDEYQDKARQGARDAETGNPRNDRVKGIKEEESENEGQHDRLRVTEQENC